MIRGDRFLLEEATHGSVDVYARTRAGSKSMVKGGGGGRRSSATSAEFGG